MNDYEIRPYEAEHFFKMNFDREQTALAIAKPTTDLAKIWKDSGPCYTGLFKGEPFAIAGVNILWPGCGEAWAIFAEGFWKHGFFIHRNAVRYLERISSEHKLKRIQAAAKSDHKNAITWLRALKFEYEGEMPCYFQGHTFSRYARIFHL